jgi:hypothetical protein
LKNRSSKKEKRLVLLRSSSLFRLYFPIYFTLVTIRLSAVPLPAEILISEIIYSLSPETPESGDVNPGISTKDENGEEIWILVTH